MSTKNQRSAFILDANFPVARELKKSNVHVIYGNPIQPPFNLLFKYIDESLLLPNHFETEEYVETLCRKIGQIGNTTLFPCSTPTVSIVSRFSKRLKAVTNFLVPNQEAMKTVYDRLQLAKFAKLTGVPTPPTKEFTDPKDADHFPLIVKPRFETGSAYGFAIIRDESDAKMAFSEKRKEKGVFYAQQDITKFLSQIENEALMFSGNNSWVNVSEHGKKFSRKYSFLHSFYEITFQNQLRF